VPIRAGRITGKTTQVTLKTPHSLVSNWVRPSSIDISSKTQDALPGIVHEHLDRANKRHGKIPFQPKSDANRMFRCMTASPIPSIAP
jgi:hypothetical protein